MLTHLRSGFHRATVRYDVALQANPLRVKMISSACINAAADFVIQMSDSSPEKKGWNPAKTAIYGIGYGAFWYAPIMHVVTTTWGRLLPSTTVLSLAFKSSVDMCTVIPVHLAAVISVQAVTKGKEPLPAVRENLYKAWSNALIVWPPVLMGVYRIPVAYRVLCMNFVSFNWNCFLIWSTSTDRRQEGTCACPLQMLSRYNPDDTYSPPVPAN